jgi:hypothetical protein
VRSLALIAVAFTALAAAGCSSSSPPSPEAAKDAEFRQLLVDRVLRGTPDGGRAVCAQLQTGVLPSTIIEQLAQDTEKYQGFEAGLFVQAAWRHYCPEIGQQ